MTRAIRQFVFPLAGRSVRHGRRGPDADGRSVHHRSGGAQDRCGRVPQHLRQSVQANPGNHLPRPAQGPGRRAAGRPSRSRGAVVDVRVLSDAPQPALLLMETGAFLLTETNGQPLVLELAPRLSARTQWQWLDAPQGQPGPLAIVGLAHREGQPRELSGGRWLSVYAKAVLDVKTLAAHRYTLNSTAVLDQLQRYYAAEKPMLAFSPEGTQFVVKGERDRPGEPDPNKLKFEHALVAFDFARQTGMVLPIDLAAWRLQGPQDIDAAFARKVVAWRRGSGWPRAGLLADRVAGPIWARRQSSVMPSERASSIHCGASSLAIRRASLCVVGFLAMP